MAPAEGADEVESEGGLPRPVGTEDGDALAPGHDQVDAGEGVGAVGPGVAQVLDVHRGLVAPVGGVGDAGAAAESSAGPFAAGGGVGRGLVGRPPGPPAAGGVAGVGRGDDERRAHLLLVAGEPDPVGADVAVHADVALAGLPVALDHEVGQAGVGAEVGGDGDGHVGMGVGPRGGVGGDAVDERALEQEQGDDGDGLRPQGAGPVEGVVEVGAGHGHEGGVDGAEAAAVLEEAGELHEVGAGVGVGGAPSDDDDGVALGGRQALEGGAGPVLGHVEDGGVDAQVAGEPEA